MLHIILGILKVAGILIGVLLLLVLTLVLALLFVPVRYRIRASGQEKDLAAGVHVSWLLHILSAAVSFESGEGLSIAIRIFGIRLPLFQKSGNSKKAGEAKPKDTKKKGRKKKKENK